MRGSILLLATFCLVGLLLIQDAQAGTRIKTVEFFINISKTQVAANGWWNTSFNVQLPENSIDVQSAWFEIYGISPRGTAGGVQTFLDNSFLSNQSLLGGTETFGFVYLVNGTNITTNATGGLYSINDNAARGFKFSLRPITTGYNVLSAKAVITYSYDDTSPVQLVTEQFFVNQSQNATNTASGVWQNSSFTVMLANQNPSVMSAWFEVGAIYQSTLVNNHPFNVVLNKSEVQLSPYNLDDGFSSDETAYFTLMVNATNVTRNFIYNITDNNVYPFHLGLRLTGDPYSAPHAKLYVTYNTTLRNQTKQEFYINTSDVTLAAGSFLNWTYDVQLFGENPKVQAAWYEIVGGAVGSASTGTIQVWGNNTEVVRPTVVGMAFAESNAFRIFANASNTSKGNTGSPYEITDNLPRRYELALRCNTVGCSALNAKLVILYNYTNPSNRTTVSFFINSSVASIPANGFFNSTYTISLPGNSPSIDSAFYDIVGNIGGTTDLTVEAYSGTSDLLLGKSLWDSSGAGQPLYRFRNVFNASNRTDSSGTPYDITDNSQYSFNLNIKCTTTICFNIGPKVHVVYQFSTVSVVVTQKVNVSIGQTLSFTPSTAYLKAFGKKTKNPLSLTTTPGRQSSLTKSFSSLLSLSNFIEKLRVRNFDVTNAIGLNNLMNNFYSFRKGLTNAISMSNLAAKLLSFSKSLTNAIGMGDFGQRVALMARSFGNAMSLGDFGQRVVLLARSFGNAMSLGDFGQRVVLLSRSLGNAISLEDVATRIVSFARSFTNALTFASDLLTDIILAPTGQTFDRAVGMAINIVDNIVNLSSFVRSLLNSISLYDVVSRITSLTRSFRDAISLEDVGTRVALLTRSFSDTIGLSNVATRIETFVRNLTNTIGLGDFGQRVVLLARSFGNAMSLGDFGQRVTLMARSFGNAISLEDVATRVQISVRNLSDAMSLSNVADNLFSLTRSFTNAIGLENISTHAALLARSFTSIMTFASDLTTNVFKQFSQSIGQALSITDNFQTALSRIRFFTNEINLSNIGIRLASLTRSFTNAFTLTNVMAVDVFRLFEKSITQVLSITDNIQTSLTRLRLSANAIILSNLEKNLYSLERNFSNAINVANDIQSEFIRLKSVIGEISLTNRAARIFNPLRQINNALNLGDFAKPLYSFTKSLSDTVNLNNVATRISSLARNFSNEMSIANAAQRFRILSSSIDQALNLSAFQQRLVGFQRITSLSFLVDAFSFSSFSQVSVSFFVPNPSLVKGDSVEFSFNVQNTGTISQNVSTGVDIYNSDNTVIASVNSTSITILAQQGKTIATFRNTIDLPADSYKASGLVFLDNRTTVNMTALFSVAASSNVQVGNYTNTSLSFSAGVPTLVSANTSSGLTNNIGDVNLGFVSNTNTSGGIAVTQFSSVENQTISGHVKLGKFFKLTPSINITDNIKWYWINISYTNADVQSVNVSESDMRIWFYDSGTATWQQESNSGNDNSTKYVWANVTHFSLFGIYAPVAVQQQVQVPVSVPSAAPPVVGGVTGIYIPPLPVIQPLPTTYIEFSQLSVLREIMPGASIVESVKITNKDVNALSNLQILISGLPADWNVVSPVNISLESGGSKVFNIVITTASYATPADYKLLITLKNSRIEESSFMIIRVKNYPSGYDKPIITRTVHLYQDINKTRVNLDVNSPVRSFPLVQVQEDIPKALATSVQQVEFSPYPDKIIQSDPIVQWDIKDLTTTRNRELSYLTSGIVDNLATYIYMPLKELTIVETRMPSGLKLVGLSVSQLLGGQSSTGKLVIENIGSVPKGLDFSMQLPAGWKMEPQKIGETIAPGESKELSFSIIVPDGAVQGDHIGTAIIVWGGDTHIREMVMHVGPVYTMWIYAGMTIAGAAAAYLFFRSRRARLPVRETPLVYKLRTIQTHIQARPVQKEVADIMRLKAGLDQDAKENLRRKIIKELVKRASERVG